MCIQLVMIYSGHSISCFIYSFVFQVISESTLCSQDFTIRKELQLYHYKFSYKFVFISFVPLVETKNQNQVIYQKYLPKYFSFSVLCQLRNTSGASLIQQTFIKKFSYMLFLIVLCFLELTLQRLRASKRSHIRK